MSIATSNSPTRATSVSEATLLAWRRTAYEAGGEVARIGRRSTLRGCFVTAWNPLGRRRPEAWNRRMQARLLERLRRVRVIAGEGRLGRWREEHLLVDADPRYAAVLGRRFRQLGIVVVGRGPARAVVLR